jgi:mannose-6-phosphate isomerase-like protein (cupin superfamily)
MIRKQAGMRVEKREKMRGGEGTVSITHLFEQVEFGAKVRLCAKMSLPPGTSIGEHRHEGEDEVYLVTKGSGLLVDGETESRVSAGDAVLTGKGQSHSVLNDGDETLEIVAFIACY